MFTLQNAQSLIGLGLTMLICWLVSEDRRRFPWRLALGAVGVQAALVLILFGAPASRVVLRAMADGVDGLGAATQDGVRFVFGFLGGGPQPYPVREPASLYILAFHVLPVILVVCALSALLWHWRILKWVTRAFGFLFQRTLGLRGAPALATAATIFMGQVEGPIFIRAYLDVLSRSELFMLVTVGMSCVAGSTMVAYATILKGVFPDVAAHVLTASIISAPAGVLLARIIIPPAPSEAGQELEPAGDKRYASSIDALMKGAGDGLTVVLNVGATLIVIVALVSMADRLLGVLPDVGGQPIGVARALGWLFAPLAWCLGIPWSEAHTAGGLLGTKLVLTEFTAFIQLAKIGPQALSERSRMIMTYALCGFANLASVGINVAGYGVLAPARRDEVVSLVWKAMLAGFLATCMTASIIGALPQGLFGR
ncbi:MAG TPA: nucleoside transporter C-terminal domain-containing protein [Caulobacteraceae bacterium]|jgi:CNT family concentrative nucleoside transporter|nr:nucleoside transporter C-terminal domain-containing protein [Caulobacteraceae bacterium]